MDALRRHAVEPPQRPTERELFTSERSIRDGLSPGEPIVLTTTIRVVVASS